MTAKVIDLVQRMRSSDPNTASRALDELRASGQLIDGALRGMSLRHARLQGANLQEADLQETDLSGADLQEANLSLANLRGTRLQKANLYKANLNRANLQEADLYQANLNRTHNLTYGQLAQVKRLRGAVMPDGRPYDGRLNLEGDIQFARAGQIDPKDEDAMAEFFAVSPEDYEHGQQWSKKHEGSFQGQPSEIKLDVIRPDDENRTA